MGLDMYLNAKRYLWHSEDELADKIGEFFPEIGNKRVKEITVQAMYWRKANAIHKWFVDFVQNGVDDCGNYEVSREQLQELIDLIDAAIEQQDASKLPPASGFFFGSTDIDAYYWEDLKQTREELSKIVNDNFPGWFFEYHSSW